MMISACVLGYSEKSIDFVTRFKELSYYKKRNSDTEGVRVHTMYVNDSDLLTRDYVCRYETRNNFANVLADGTEKTNKENSIGSDLEWLLASDGHDMVFEAAEDPEKYVDALIGLAAKGYWIVVTSDLFKGEYWDQLNEAASASGGRVSTYELMYELFNEIDAQYKNRLERHRKNLYEESLTAKPCGLP